MESDETDTERVRQRQQQRRRVKNNIYKPYNVKTSDTGRAVLIRTGHVCIGVK